jgi:ribosomal protein L44E
MPCPYCRKCNDERSRRASVKHNSKAPARRRRYERRQLQINHAAVVAVGFAAAAFYLFWADVALN